VSPARGAVIPASHIDRTRANEDIALLAELGANTIRIGINWAWMQPAAGAVDGDALEFYLGLAQTARAANVALQLTLLERNVPNWFDNDGGFADDKWAGHWWPRWVEVCAESFGDNVGGWVPIEHPLAIANRLFPNDPRRHGDVLDTLVTAWRDAWRILRGGPPVTTSFGLEIVRPVDDTVEAAEAARRMDQIRFTLWLQGLRDGIASIPGRADREVADLAGSCDVVGIVVRHERDTLGLLHRAAEQGLADRPLAVTLLLPDGTDADRELVVERFLEQSEEAATGLPMETVSINPTFDLPGDERGVITRDRDLKDSGRLFFGLQE
jgi:Glycosyl hydrolase family 1